MESADSANNNDDVLYSIAYSPWRNSLPESHRGSLKGSTSYIVSEGKVVFNIFRHNVRICTTIDRAREKGYIIGDDSKGTFVAFSIENGQLVRSAESAVNVQKLEHAAAKIAYDTEYGNQKDRDFVLDEHGGSLPPPYNEEDSTREPPPTYGEIRGDAPPNPPGYFPRLAFRVRSMFSRIARTGRGSQTGQSR